MTQIDLVTTLFVEQPMSHRFGYQFCLVWLGWIKKMLSRLGNTLFKDIREKCIAQKGKSIPSKYEKDIGLC